MDRRSVLVAAGAALTGLGTLTSTASAQEESERLIGEGEEEIQTQQEAEPLQFGGREVEPGELIQGELTGDDPVWEQHTYLVPASSGDRISATVARSGGQGGIFFQLNEPVVPGQPGLTYVLDSVPIQPDGTDDWTGQEGPHTLTAVTNVGGPGHTVTVSPYLEPQPFGSYEFVFENHGRES